jgi:iron complex outermembrane receptor protein
MIFGARTTVRPLHAGQRDFAETARAHRFAVDPEGYVTDPPASNAVTVFSQEGNLTFDPAFGGGALGSRVTSVPTGLSGSLADHAAVLAANAGRLIFDLQRDDSGTGRYLLSNPTITSAIFNVRHRFGRSVEAFVDVLYFRNDGRFQGQGPSDSVFSPAGAANNPFQQDVVFQFPNLAVAATSKTKLQSIRGTAGLLVDFGSSWKGALDVTLGRVKTALDTGGTTPNFSFANAIRQGAIDPLGDWRQFTAAMATHLQSLRFTTRQDSRFDTESFRLGGPVLQAPGGAVNLTILAERRQEHAPVGKATISGDTFDIEFPFPLRTQTVTSGYAELRAPILSQDTRLAPLRGLELQMAVRYDRVATLFPDDASRTAPSNEQLTTITNAGLT